MTVPPRLPSLGQEVCFISSGMPRLQCISGNSTKSGTTATEQTRTYLWSRTMVSSILLFLPAGVQSLRPTGVACFPSLGWENLPGGANGFPDMKLVWPNIGRASGVRLQGVQRWVSMPPQMTDPRPKGQGAEASSLPLSFQESFERGPPGCDAVFANWSSGQTRA